MSETAKVKQETPPAGSRLQQVGQHLECLPDVVPRDRQPGRIAAGPQTIEHRADRANECVTILHCPMQRFVAEVSASQQTQRE